MIDRAAFLGVKITDAATKNKLREKAGLIHCQTGIVTRKICDIPAQHFGIPRIPESYCSYNSEFVYLPFAWLLRDAQEEEIAIPCMRMHSGR